MRKNEFRFKAITPMGNFFSLWLDLTKEDFKSKMKEVCENGDYVMFDNGNNVIYLPKGIIQQSVFVVEYK